MTVSTLGTATTSGSSTSSSTSGATPSLGKDDFLKILVTQLQNQDPLNPTDSTQFVSQLAQFSALEQMTNVNTNLQTVQALDQSINNSLAPNFIGKTVLAKGSTFNIATGGTYNIQYQLAKDATTVNTSIYDSSGNNIRTITSSNVAAGQQSITWDGKDNNGATVDAGQYSFTIQAKDSSGNAMSTAAYIQVDTTGVSYHDGSTYLTTKDAEIPYSSVIKVTPSSASQ